MVFNNLGNLLFARSFLQPRKYDRICHGSATVQLTSGRRSALLTKGLRSFVQRAFLFIIFAKYKSGIPKSFPAPGSVSARSSASAEPGNLGGRAILLGILHQDRVSSSRTRRCNPPYRGVHSSVLFRISPDHVENVRHTAKTQATAKGRLTPRTHRSSRISRDSS
jgi:hypothetical protein